MKQIQIIISETSNENLLKIKKIYNDGIVKLINEKIEEMPIEIQEKIRNEIIKKVKEKKFEI